MRVGQGVGHSGSDQSGLWPAWVVLQQPAAKVRAVKVIGDQIKLPLMHAYVVDGHNAVVTQLGEPPRLLQGLFILDLAAARSTLMATGRSSFVSWPR